MGTGFRGTFVISWSQTKTDGVTAAPMDVFAVGVTWRWSGKAVRVDGAPDVLLLDGAKGEADIRQRAARVVGRLIGPAASTQQRQIDGIKHEDAPERGFVVTDGRRSYSAAVIDVPDTGARLVVFVDQMPPANVDLWVVRLARNLAARRPPSDGAMICFAPDTAIRTADGAQLIQHLRVGDKIVTKDNGLQEILWAGHRRVTAGRLYAMPHLRPIRFRAGALGLCRPDADLYVSPQHRMVVSGAAAMALFNTPEVLVAAEGLVNGTSIQVDLTPRDAVYIHIMLPQHQVIWANGLETESFHPANAALDQIEESQRSALQAVLPAVTDDPFAYGDYARRNLTAPEAAILRYDLAA